MSGIPVLAARKDDVLEKICLANVEERQVSATTIVAVGLAVSLSPLDKVVTFLILGELKHQEWDDITQS
jgi:hypothetical protein